MLFLRDLFRQDFSTVFCRAWKNTLACGLTSRYEIPIILSISMQRAYGMLGYFTK